MDDNAIVVEWLTVKQAAKRINTSMSYIRKAITMNRLPARDISLGSQRREWRIRVRDLENFMIGDPARSPSLDRDGMTRDSP